MFYPDYQPVDRPAAWERFERAWDRELDHVRGLTVTEIVGAALNKGVRGMYMMGENPFLSDPNINKVRKALSALDFLAVQDIFLTETAEFADVILPASSYLEKDGSYTNTDRRVQRGRKVLDPPGEARVDWEIIQDIANRVGLPMDYESADEIFDELVSLMPNYTNLNYDNLGPTGKLYPNSDPEQSDGTVVLFQDAFNTDDGLAHLVPAEWMPARELPNEEYPFVLNTGRLLEHWHTGSMTRRSFALDAISPHASVFLNPADAERMGIADGDFARVTSRRGSIELRGARSRTARRPAAASSRFTSARPPRTCSPSTRSTRPERSPSSSSVPCASSRPACPRRPRTQADGNRQRPRPRARGAGGTLPRSQPDPIFERHPDASMAGCRARSSSGWGARPNDRCMRSRG